MKKRLSMILASGICLLFSSSVSAASTFTDLDRSFAKQHIIKLAQDGYIDGYRNPNGTYSFKPEQEITRQEFAKMLVKAVGLEEKPEACIFTDVADWAKGYVGALYEAEITKGISATKYGANLNLNREQMATFFVRAMGMEQRANDSNPKSTFSDRWEISDYAQKNVAFAQQIGLINGVGNNEFKPEKPTQRQEVARLMYELVYHYEDYVPRIIKVENSSALQVNVNADGTYTVVYPASEGKFTADQIKITRAEFEKRQNWYYEVYRKLVLTPIGKKEWTESLATNEQKAAFVNLLVLAWSLTHSPNDLPDQVVASNENLGIFIGQFIAKTNEFFNNPANADAKLYEPTLINLVNQAYESSNLGSGNGSDNPSGGSQNSTLLGGLLGTVVGLLKGLLGGLL